MRLESESLGNQHFELLILPPLCLRLLAQLLQHRQSCGRVSLSQMYPGLTDRDVVCLRQMSGCRQVALPKQREHLDGSHLRYTIHKVLLARVLGSLREQYGGAGHIFLGPSQVGKKHLTDNEAVNHSLILPREVEALAPVLRSLIQVIPFVEDTGETKM